MVVLESAMKNIAFVYTEYQQNILFAICLQTGVKIDTLFIRNNIAIHSNATMYVDAIVRFEDIPFSWRQVGKYYQEYKKTVSPYIHTGEAYRIFTWSLTNPVVRYAINFSRCKQIALFEDGSGSYVKWGSFNRNYGHKTFLVSLFVFSFTNVLSMSLLPLKKSNMVGWSLFENCYPDLNIQNNLISHSYFQKIIWDALNKENTHCEIENNAIVFINSPYVEFSILSEKEYESALIDTVEKIISHTSSRSDTIYWKLHPRTNREKEKSRLENIARITGVTCQIIEANESMESFALKNQDKQTEYYSLGSSALYVIKALVNENTSVYLIENDTLKSKLGLQEALIGVYKTIGIGVL